MGHFHETLSLVDAPLRGHGPYRRALAIGGLAIASLGEAAARRILPKLFLSKGFQWSCRILANRRAFLLSTLVAKFLLTGYDLTRDMVRVNVE